MNVDMLISGCEITYRNSNKDVLDKKSGGQGGAIEQVKAKSLLLLQVIAFHHRRVPVAPM